MSETAHASAPRPTPTASSASSLLRAARTARVFTSGSASFDSLLGRVGGGGGASSSRTSQSPGLARGALLDVVGAPGEGKSRIVLGFAVGARLRQQVEPGDVKGKVKATPVLDDEREVLLIDTEGDLSASAIHAAALVQSQGNAQLARQACDGIHLVAARSPEELMAILLSLGAWLDAHPRVQLVALDCLTTHLRTALFPNLPPDPNARTNGSGPSTPTQNGSASKKRARGGWGSNAAGAEDDDQAALRTHLIATIKRVLTQLTAARNLSVIVTNQVASMHKNALGQRVKPSQADHTVYVPQLGHLWQPPNTYRVFLFGDTDGSRIAGLYEAPGSSDRRYVQYEVEAGGICDIEAAAN